MTNSYATVADIKAYDDLMSDTKDVKLEQALLSASSEIDGYVATRLRTPLTNEYNIIPEVVKEWCVIIAVYKLSASLDSYTDEKRRRYEDVITTLTSFTKGNFKLPDENRKPIINTVSNATSNSKRPVFFNSNERLFTAKTMRGL